MAKPKALILLATGTNRDGDAAFALEKAGALPEVAPLNLLRDGRVQLKDYQMFILPGGFSYADALGAGRLIATDLVSFLNDQLRQFVDAGKPVIGICNGFQALVKAGVLPIAIDDLRDRQATLTFNEQGHFECRWVTLNPLSSKCIWTSGLTELIDCPIAHGEGNFMLTDANDVMKLYERDQIALVYTHPNGEPANQSYPANPNGSLLDIAGLCNPQGNVLGLMPHPENHVLPEQHPHWKRAYPGHSGLPLFINGVKYASQL